MKKLFSLLAAVLFAGSMMAVTLDPAAQTAQTAETDINLTIEGIQLAYHGTLNAASADGIYPADFRVYGGKTLTLTAATNISKVVIAGKANKAGFTASVDKGTVTTGASYTDITEKKTLSDPLVVIESVNAQSVTITVSKQLRAYMIEVTLDGEGGGDEPVVNPGTGDAVKLDVVYAEAAYLADYEAWQLNLYKDYDENTYKVTYPDFYVGFMAKSATALAGTYTTSELAYAIVFMAEKDSAEAVSYPDNMVINYKGNDIYSVKLSFVGDDNKTYTVDWEGEIYAYDYDSEEDIILDENGGTPSVNPGELASEGVHTLKPVEADAAGKGTYDIIVDGIRLAWEGAYYATDFRPYAGKSLTITAGANIAKVEIAGMAKKELAPTVNNGTITTGTSFNEDTTKEDINDPLIVIENVNATSVTIACNKQLRAQIIRVTLDGKQALSNTAVETKAAKTLRNGILVIEKAGVRYNVMGQIIR